MDTNKQLAHPTVPPATPGAVPRDLPPARRAMIAIIALLTSLLAVPALAQSIRVQAALASDRVYVGDDIQYQIIIENSQDVTPPAITAPPGLSIDYSGASQQPAPTMYVNNRRIDTGPDKYILIYRVSASRPGVYTIPAQTLRVAGEDRTVAAVRLTVTEPPEDTSSILEASLSSDTAYVGEPITLTLTWSFAADVRGVRFTTLRPEAAPSAAATGYDVLAAPDPRPAGTRPNDPGFYNLQFDGQDMVCSVGRTLRGGREYGVVTAKRTIVPTAEGRLEIGPFAAIAQVVTGTRPIGILMNQDVVEPRTSRSKPVALNVRPLPTEGRPANFNGLVGEFSLTASAEPTDVSVGDPIALRVRVSGPEPLDRVVLPDLDRTPAFPASFRLTAEGLRLDSEQATGRRAYSTTLRATSDRVTQIPPIELPYFDTRSGTYRVARSAPIPLTVRPTRQVTAGDAVVSQAPGTTPTTPAPIAAPPLLAAQPGLHANSTSPAALRNEQADLRTLLTQPVWASGLVLPPLMFAAVSVLALARRAVPTEAQRRRHAARRARHMLRARPSDVATALRTYIGERFDVPTDSVTSFDSGHLLADASPGLRAAFASLLDRADGARLDDAAPPTARDASDLLKRLDQEEAR